ncbi:MAG: phosphate/phosphite/phosphonate ABC transporter substrate-binding protein [Planctomycetota bacterium]|nr:MAG: phosphate/phosphite/phosphonate ABC transporter substrate-binding protein [Planctomycetota bacterium]REK44376.1 MAG: phosphate/phosphite/phosphonate ABC transporter substrate-binding protein [Planctomycetota bacterium]
MRQQLLDPFARQQLTIHLHRCHSPSCRHPQAMDVLDVFRGVLGGQRQSALDQRQAMAKGQERDAADAVLARYAKHPFAVDDAGVIVAARRLEHAWLAAGSRRREFRREFRIARHDRATLPWTDSIVAQRAQDSQRTRGFKETAPILTKRSHFLDILCQRTRFSLRFSLHSWNLDRPILMNARRRQHFTFCPPPVRLFFALLLWAALVLTGLVGCSDTESLPDGSAELPLRVMLVPADGGTEDGTRADFEPIFNGITQVYDLHFDIRVGSSYNAVVEAMANDQVDIAFFGAVSYQIAKQRANVELLAVEERDGKSEYFSGIYARADSGIDSLEDFAGKTVAFGDVSSTSSFSYPAAMLLEAGVNPAQDLKAVVLAGNHANALRALVSGNVDGACASLDSFKKAVDDGKLSEQELKLVQKSQPIPSPPLAMNGNLADKTKTQLKTAFREIHEHPDVELRSLKGYAGKNIDRYNPDFSEERFDLAMAPLDAVTKELKDAMIRRAAEGN